VRLKKFRHKALKRLYEADDPKGLAADQVEKLRHILFALETAETVEQVGRFPGWRLHALKGELKGYWSLTVSGNWRLIFRFDQRENTATDLDLIDYH